ncbi:MAG: LAGLIDADG family homing endonuclease [Candidatus Omnitrophota bacterium]
MAEQIIKNKAYFRDNGQADFLKKSISRIGKSLGYVAKLCNVDKRTLYDWRRGEYQMDYDAAVMLAKAANLSCPAIDILPRYWYVKNGARIGAIKRNKLYGNPGTEEGRRKGGLVTIAKFKKNVYSARRSGFKIRKKIKYPKKSELLAEFIGIMLGDGNLNVNQAKITLNSKTDREYSRFVYKSVVKLFDLQPSLKYRAKNTIEILIYSRNIVDFLIECGLKIGNKIVNQVDVPIWIFKKDNFIKGCLRGLVDTDGGIYFHQHTTKGIEYKNIGLCFTNHSLPLLNSAEQMFLSVGIKAKSDKKRHVSVYGLDSINKYMLEVGTSNLKNKNKILLYKRSEI